MNRNKLVSQFEHPDGHMRVSLCATKEHSPLRYSRGSKFSVHRLVANEYIESPHDDKSDCINHMDCNPKNNYYENLEWCTDSYNREHARINELFLHGEDNPASIFTEDNARHVCKMLESGMRPYDIGEEYCIYGKTKLQIRDFARHIYLHNTWNHVSKDYNF